MAQQYGTAGGFWICDDVECTAVMAAGVLLVDEM